jgi:putative sigma-54 modulation protein
MNRKAKALEFVDEGYSIKITGRHVEVTDSMKAYALEKISKIERFNNRIIDVNVIMDIQKLEHRVEIILKVNDITVRSLACSNDMYASIDKAVDKIESQLRKYKTKIQDHHAKGLSAIDMKVNVWARPGKEEEEFFEEEEEEENFEETYEPHQIVKQEILPVKMLTDEEAIMKMELSGEAFLLFKHEADQRLKVIYRRPDGNYGIIEPQC